MTQLLAIHEPGQTPDPHGEAEDRGPAIGIDFGTTNTVVAIARQGVCEIPGGSGRDRLIPSVVACAADGSLLVGDAADRLATLEPERGIRSVKRLLGRSAGAISRLDPVLFRHLAPSTRDGTVRIHAGGRELTPPGVAALILGAARDRAQEALGRPPGPAVITVPAYFDDTQRAATRAAAQMAGIEVLRLVSEPTAAALAYGLERGASGLHVVHDLGGGTFDVSILRLQDGIFRVLATGGDTALGGDDFDHVLARLALEKAGLPVPEAGLPVPEAGTPAGTAAGKRLLAEARRAREALGETGEVTLALPVPGDAPPRSEPVRVRITRAEFEAAAAPLLARMRTILRNVMRDAGIRAAQVGGIVLVGGASRMPVIRREVEQVLGQQPLRGIDPDCVVACGAALQAETLTGGGNGLLIDVCPLSLGIGTMGGLTERLIGRNTPLPCRAVREFTTYEDGQSGMVIEIVQGEQELVEDNRRLGRFSLGGIPPMLAGTARVEVCFSLDVDGILTVSAQERSTGASQYIEILPGSPGQEVAGMTGATPGTTEDGMRERLLRESAVEAGRLWRAVLSALESDGHLLEQPVRDDLLAQAEALKQASEGRDREEIERLRARLETDSRGFAGARMNRLAASVLPGMSIDAGS